MAKDKPMTIAAAVALSCVGVFGLLPQPLFVGALQDHLAFSSGQAALVTGVEIIGGAFSSILAAFWIRKISWRTAALFGIGVVVLGNAASSLADSYGALLGLRFAVGLLGQGVCFAVAIATISETSETDRNFAFSIAAQVAFGIAGFRFLPFAVAEWQVAGILGPLAVVAVLIAPLLRWLPAGSSHKLGPAAEQGGASALPALAALGTLLIWCAGLGGIYAFEERIGIAAGLESTTVGSALASAVAAGFVGALAASAVADRWGRIPPVAVALGGQMVGIWLLQGDLSWLQFATIASVFHFFWNFTGPYLMGNVASLDATGRMVVLIPAAQFGGFAIGNGIGGQAVAGAGLSGANLVGVGGCALALVAFMILALRRRSATTVAPH